MAVTDVFVCLALTFFITRVERFFFACAMRPSQRQINELAPVSVSRQDTMLSSIFKVNPPCVSGQDLRLTRVIVPPVSVLD